MLKERRTQDRWFVYQLRNSEVPADAQTGQGSRTTYVGITKNLAARIGAHNRGEVTATRGRQWDATAWFQVGTQSIAATVERWLKHGDTTAKRRMMREAAPATGAVNERMVEHLVSCALLADAKARLERNFGIDLVAASTYAPETEKEESIE